MRSPLLVFLLSLAGHLRAAAAQQSQPPPPIHFSTSDGGDVAADVPEAAYVYGGVLGLFAVSVVRLSKLGVFLVVALPPQNAARRARRPGHCVSLSFAVAVVCLEERRTSQGAHRGAG